MKPRDYVIWKSPVGNDVHIWEIKAVHLGPVGTESIVEIENVSHKPGWTGKCETHVSMFVPEVLLRGCRFASEAPAHD